jgi:hypothetical protein
MPVFQKACVAIIAIGVLNFAVFVIVASRLGGDAVNGKDEGGHYYLFGVRTESGHKVYTEVGESVFTYSKWHVYSLLVTWPLVMAAGYARSRCKKRLSDSGGAVS